MGLLCPQETPQTNIASMIAIHRVPQKRGQNMTNETNNETATNETSDNMTLELGNAVEESGLLDTLMDSPELMVCLAVIAALAAYLAYTQPKIRALVMPYIKKYDNEILELLDDNLTKAQLKAYEKLDEQVKKQVNNKVLQDVIMSAWDEKDDMMADAVKQKVKAALDEAK